MVQLNRAQRQPRLPLGLSSSMTAEMTLHLHLQVYAAEQAISRTNRKLACFHGLQ